MIHVVEIYKIDDWLTDLEAFDYSVFISSHWLESMRNKLQVPLYLNIIEEGVVIAKMAGLATGKRRSKRSKLLFYAGPALRKDGTKGEIKGCFHLILNYGRCAGYNQIVIASYDYPYEPPRHNRFSYNIRSEYIIDLTRSKEKIEESISRNIKRSVKKAIGLGYVVRESGDESLTGPLVSLMEETRKVRLSKGYSDYNYFYLAQSAEKSLMHLARSGVITFFVIERDQKIHAILAMMLIDRRAYAMYVGASEESYCDGVPSLIDYSVIDLLRERNISYLNFGGIPDNKSHAGLINFKIKLGCTAHRSLQSSTGFLQFPYTLLNPVNKLVKLSPDNHFIRYLKKGIKFLFRSVWFRI